MKTKATAVKKEVSATSTVEPKKVLKKKKLVKVSKAETDTKNIKDTVTKIVESKREVKYIYPSELGDDALKKKAWRAKMRIKDKDHLKDIAKAKKTKEDPAAIAKLEAAYTKWRKGVYLVP